MLKQFILLLGLSSSVLCYNQYKDYNNDYYPSHEKYENQWKYKLDDYFNNHYDNKYTNSYLNSNKEEDCNKPYNNKFYAESENISNYEEKKEEKYEPTSTKVSEPTSTKVENAYTNRVITKPPANRKNDIKSTRLEVEKAAPTEVIEFEPVF